MASLSILDSQMSHLSVSDDDMDDYSSQCSHYSLADLEDDEWLLHIPASEVRRQAKLVPDAPSPGANYPHDFLNKEQLPLSVSGPMMEYPLCLNGRYVYGNPGPARLLVTPSRPGSLDVVYHRNRHDRGFLQAKYRPKGYRRGPLGNTTPTFATPPSPALGYGLGLPYSTPSLYQGACGTELHDPYFPSLHVSKDMLSQQYASQDYTNFWTSYLYPTAMAPMPTPTFGFWPLGLNGTQY